MTIELITNYDEFVALEPVWDELVFLSGYPHLNLTFKWIDSWINVFWKDEPLYFLMAKDAGKIIGIAPLVIHTTRRPFRMRQLMFAASGVSDFSGFIIKENSQMVIEKFFLHLMKNSDKWDNINLRNISDRGYGNSLDNENLNGNDFQQDIVPGYVCPEISLLCGYDQYSSHLSNKLKSDLRKKRNKLETLGPLSFSVHSKITASLFQYFANLEKNRKKNRLSFHDLFLHSEKKEFAYSVMKNYSLLNDLKIFVLEQNSKILSYIIGFEIKGIMYFWTTSFSQEFGKYSPGMLIFQDAIKYCFDAGIEKIDFMAGQNDYKLRWSNNSYQLFNLNLTHKSLKTNFYKLNINTKKGLSKIKNRFSHS